MIRRNKILIGAIVVVAAAIMLGAPLISYTPTGCGRGSATRSMLSSLKMALDLYYSEYGTYPPDSITTDQDGLDKPSETLYFYLVGENIDSPCPEKRADLRRQRAGQTVFMDFIRNMLADFDGDGNYEIVDAYGRPWIYVRRLYAGEKRMAPMGNPDDGYRPWHNREAYDIFSVGHDGKTGTRWIENEDALKLGPTHEESFYRQATDEREDGLKSAGGYSADDISNF